MSDIAKRTRDLANELFKSPPCSQMQAGGVSCLHSEDQRALTPAEKREGHVRRGFDMYDPARMCASCRAYWHVELAAQALERKAALDRYVEARR
jgi:hypothetical protein